MLLFLVYLWGGRSGSREALTEVPLARRHDMDEPELRPGHITVTGDGYLSRPLAAAYLWRSRRGLRGRLSQISYYLPDGQMIFKKAGFTTNMERFRVDSPDSGELVEKSPGSRKKHQKKHDHEGSKSSSRKNPGA